LIGRLKLQLLLIRLKLSQFLFPGSCFITMKFSDKSTVSLGKNRKFVQELALKRI
jgi:hypothetical protein